MEKKMQLIIICIIYTIALTLLGSIAVKNFFNMREKNDPLRRQYFFATLIFLCILIISFIAILLKLKRDIFIGDGASSGAFIGYSDTTGYGLLGFIILIIIGIAAIVLFDRFFLKRRSKTEQEYRIRRKLAVATVIILIGIIAALRLIW